MGYGVAVKYILGVFQNSEKILKYYWMSFHIFEENAALLYSLDMEMLLLFLD